MGPHISIPVDNGKRAAAGCPRSSGMGLLVERPAHSVPLRQPGGSGMPAFTNDQAPALPAPLAGPGIC